MRPLPHHCCARGCITCLVGLSEMGEQKQQVRYGITSLRPRDRDRLPPLGPEAQSQSSLIPRMVRPGHSTEHRFTTTLHLIHLSRSDKAVALCLPNAVSMSGWTSNRATCQ